MMAMMSSLVSTLTSIEVVEAEFFVDTVTAHLAEVVAFLGEEEVCDDLARAGVVRWIGVAQLPVDVLDGLFLRV